MGAKQPEITDDHYLSITLMVSLALYSLFSIGNMKDENDTRESFSL